MQVNTEEETAMEYAIYATVGLLSGLCFYYLARYQIQVRSIYDTENRFLALAENEGSKLELISGTDVLWKKDIEGNIEHIFINHLVFYTARTTSGKWNVVLAVLLCCLLIYSFYTFLLKLSHI